MRGKKIFGILLGTWLCAAVLGPYSQAAPQASLREQLCEQARREGQLNLLTNVALVADPLVELFQEQFPGLRVRAVTDVAAPTRAITEAQAGRHEHDILVWTIPGVLPLFERNLLASFKPEELTAFRIPPGTAILNNTTLKFYNFVHTLSYDSRRLRPEDVPRDWNGILNPRWRERFVGDIPTVTNGIAALGLLLGEAWATNFARRLRDEVRITIVPNPTIGREMVLRGEKDLMWGGIGETIDRRERFREPLAWNPVTPTYASQFVVVAFQRAPHPNAARCVALWAATQEAKPIMERKAYFLADATPGARTQLRREIERHRMRIFFENVESAKRRLELYGRLVPILQGQVP
ncbi:MAG: hypothetical protein N0A24_12085 [Armatimonadetes bacterium]|nr:hypothetical protein [Armatimonadota bacterium]MDW8154906.1 hypothetical protein [Armatimonadota bacterium]